MKRKTILRREWKGIHSRLYAEKRFSAPGISGIAGLLHMEKADDFSVSVGKRRVKITSDGYEWLQIAPEGKRVWATVMFDDRSAASECYFDITSGNTVSDGGQSEFMDLYLDVVIAPDDPNVYYLDAEELEGAFEAGEVTQSRKELAYASRDELIRSVRSHKQEFFAWCSETRKELSKRLKKVEDI